MRLLKLKVVQAFAFLAIPLVLWGFNDFEVLGSISAYVNFTPIAFTFCLSMAGALFIYDGFGVDNRSYNIYIGLSLFGVVFLNHLDYPVLHYIFAAIFFLGSLFNMVFFSSNKERFIKIVVALFVLFGMAGHFFFGWYSLFWAEWIGMVPISGHYILESLGKID